MLAAVGSEQRDRGFLTDSFCLAPDVTVEDEIAEDEDAGVSQRFHALDEVRGHAGRPP